jgi:hypothetical protein
MYGIYHLAHTRNHQKTIECIEQALSLKPEEITVSILLATRGALLSCIDKYNLLNADLQRPFRPSKMLSISQARRTS